MSTFNCFKPSDAVPLDVIENEFDWLSPLLIVTRFGENETPFMSLNSICTRSDMKYYTYTPTYYKIG